MRQFASVLFWVATSIWLLVSLLLFWATLESYSTVHAESRWRSATEMCGLFLGVTLGGLFFWCAITVPYALVLILVWWMRKIDPPKPRKPRPPVRRLPKRIDLR